MNNSNTVLSRVVTVATVATLVFALNISGALAGFWRTFDGITDNSVPNPMEFLFGQGTDGTTNGLFGYGFGYGNGSFGSGSVFESTSSSSGGSSSSVGTTSSSSSSSSSGGATTSSSSSS